MILHGIVQKGKQRGKALGFPTANIPLTQNIGDGIYMSLVMLDSKKYPSLTFIGIAETFDDTERSAEVYLLDFDKDIYGKRIEVELLKKLRENKKFESTSALVKQMKDDTMEAREYFKFDIRNKIKIQMTKK